MGGAHKRAVPTRLPEVVVEREGRRVAELMGDLDLSDVTKTSKGDLQAMESAARPEGPGTAPAAIPAVAQRTQKATLPPLTSNPSEEQSYKIGQTYEVPLHVLQDSKFNARVYYAVEEIDATAASLVEKGQDVPVSVFIEGDKLTIIDGSKRLRAARAAGLETLRIEVKEQPESNLQLYLASRRMNLERSSQTCFDDAVRFQMLLDEKHFPDQAALGKAMGGISQPLVSQTLSLNKIPPNVLKVMRERRPDQGPQEQPKMCQLSFAVEIARMFDGSGTDGVEREQKAIEVVREVVERDLSVKQTKDLVKSRLDGPRPRQQAETKSVNYAGGTGSLKVFASRGQIDLSIRNVDAAKLDELTAKIEDIFAKASEGG